MAGATRVARVDFDATGSVHLSIGHDKEVVQACCYKWDSSYGSNNAGKYGNFSRTKLLYLESLRCVRHRKGLDFRATTECVEHGCSLDPDSGSFHAFKLTLHMWGA